MKKVIAIGDTHLPFEDQDAISFVYSIIQKEKPQVVIQVGDLLDWYCAAKWPHDPNIMTPKQEIEQGLKSASEMWKTIQKLSPKAQCIQLLGNHCLRPPKRVMELLPAMYGFFRPTDCYSFAGVKTILDAREELEIDGIIYIHGHYSQLGQHMRYYNQSVIHGHSHRPGIVYERRKNKTIFEMDVGHLADETLKPLQYSSTKTTKWSQGVGLVDEYGPRFIHI